MHCAVCTILEFQIAPPFSVIKFIALVLKRNYERNIYQNVLGGVLWIRCCGDATDEQSYSFSE